MFYAYSLKVVPINDLEKYKKSLATEPKPVDKYSALKVGAFALLVIRTASRCLNNIPEEKRLLTIWVRDARSSVRRIRGKGTSSRRASLNAQISNSADATKNKLDQIKSYAPQAIEFGESKLALARQFTTLKEIEAYIPNCLARD